jgi:hypothetical protein
MISPNEVEGFRETYLNNNVEALLGKLSESLEYSILYHPEPKNDYTISASYVRVKPWAVETVLSRVMSKFQEVGWQITNTNKKLLDSSNNLYEFTLTLNRQTNHPYR